MKALLAIALAAWAAAPVFAADATFERTLTVNGQVELAVTTGSGSIHLTPSTGGQVHIVGHVRSSWGANEDQVREIAAHPPIEQTGNIVRVGARHETLHNIGIDYDIQAPADAFLEAGSGSGSITDDGVGTNARIHTGSGSIHASGLRGGYSIGTGSGSIDAEQTGQGDDKAQTGSGSIELRNVHGALEARTGSGHIKVTGTPSGPWHIDTGSGGVEIWTGGAAFTLDAACGSGGIRSDRPVTTQGRQSRRHLSGTVNGGGPTVRIHTGSGSIHID
ncbi:MAG: DUF4097 family beta strand repeat-containing protein [Acidobacteriota bacterium]